MDPYWYSTNGLVQRRLSTRHLSVLDQAYEMHTRIQLLDDELFGQNIVAVANPYQGTMTAGDLHYGLYRQPPIWQMSNTDLDTFILDLQSDDDNNNDSNNSNNSNSNKNDTKYNKLISKSKVQTNIMLEEHCICCRIS